MNSPSKNQNFFTFPPKILKKFLNFPRKSHAKTYLFQYPSRTPSHPLLISTVSTLNPPPIIASISNPIFQKTQLFLSHPFQFHGLLQALNSHHHRGPAFRRGPCHHWTDVCRKNHCPPPPYQVWGQQWEVYLTNGVLWFWSNSVFDSLGLMLEPLTKNWFF